MRILLLHPEDSPLHGPWSGQRWDLIVDLGRSSAFSATSWESKAQCPVLRSDAFRRGVEDLRLIREMFAVGRGRLLDEEGIDWWDIVSLLFAQEAEAVLVLRRLVAEIDPGAELWATRANWPAGDLGAALGRTVRVFSSNAMARLTDRAAHYAKFFRRFSAGQMKEIFLDKYDSNYEWRSRFASKPSRSAESVILLPSAYGNVSRMAASYAAMLPERFFLLVATRRSAWQFQPQANIRVQDLGAYVRSDSAGRECEHLLERWNTLRLELCSDPEFDWLARAGIFGLFPRWLRDGMRARDAWCEVLNREPVTGVLCGDDSNPFTRLPVLLAAGRKIPTIDFHHGALDGRYLLKELPCNVYLAKNEMEQDYLVRVCGLPAERIAIGAPRLHLQSAESAGPSQKTSVIFFSEPYENVGMRVEEVYRELLPPLCRLARENGRDVVVKLHPFESVSERKKLVRRILSPEDFGIVTVLDGPLSANLLSRAWFGITVESTTVIDCVVSGIPCFLCGWLTLSSYGYTAQYARYGVGGILQNVNLVAEIPYRLKDLHSFSKQGQSLWKIADQQMLQHWFAGAAPIGARLSL